MNILIIHQYYKTPEDGGAIRSYHIANYLTQMGHDVSVITAYNEPKYQSKKIDGVAVHYLPIYYTNHLSFWSRIHAFWRYVKQTKRLIKKLPKADLHYVISTPLTTGLVALWAKKNYDIPFIFEVGDLWPEAPIQLGVIKNQLVKKWSYKLEKRVYENSQSIVALSPDIKAFIERKTNKPVTVITNLSDTEYFRPDQPTDKLRNKLAYNNKFIVAYIGTVGLANELELLLDAAETCLSDKRIQFVVMGSGARWDAIAAQAVARGLKNVAFYPGGNKNQARDMLAMADAVYVSFKSAPILSTGSPNKFFDGLAAGKLIIINFGGWITEVINESGCGFSYNPQKPKEFRQHLIPYIENQDKLAKAKEAARSLAESEFSLDKQLPKLLNVLEE